MNLCIIFSLGMSFDSILSLGVEIDNLAFDQF